MASNVAFEILYREYYVRVYGLCRRLLRSAPLAEDATQEAFMKAYRRFDSYDTSQPFWHWMATIANHHCIDVLRRQKTGKEAFFGDEGTEIEELESSDAGALSELIEAESAERLAAAIDELPDRYRLPLVLAYHSDMTYEQIAVQLEVSRNHVGVLILRAKEQLRRRLTGEHA